MTPSDISDHHARLRRKIIGLGEHSHQKSYYPELKKRIAELEAQSAKLTAALNEKDVLIKEIHHRVKNNLQLISSLLNLQARNQENDAVIQVLAASTNRIKSIALIHESLYQDELLARVNFSAYVSRFVKYLEMLVAVEDRSIDWQLDVEPLNLTIQHAIPCGLIVNELVTNALKYAFPPDFEGEPSISIKFNRCDDRFCLTVKDNGVGPTEEIDLTQTESLGLHLVYLLAKEQMDGDVTLRVDKGCEYSIWFRDEKREE